MNKDLRLMNMLVPPRRNVSQFNGNGVLDASTNTLILSRSIPRLSKIGCTASLQYKHISYNNTNNNQLSPVY